MSPEAQMESDLGISRDTPNIFVAATHRPSITTIDTDSTLASGSAAGAGSSAPTSVASNTKRSLTLDPDSSSDGASRVAGRPILTLRTALPRLTLDSDFSSSSDGSLTILPPSSLGATVGSSIRGPESTASVAPPDSACAISESLRSSLETQPSSPVAPARVIPLHDEDIQFTPEQIAAFPTPKMIGLDGLAPVIIGVERSLQIKAALAGKHVNATPTSVIPVCAREYFPAGPTDRGYWTHEQAEESRLRKEFKRREAEEARILASKRAGVRKRIMMALGRKKGGETEEIGMREIKGKMPNVRQPAGPAGPAAPARMQGAVAATEREREWEQEQAQEQQQAEEEEQRDEELAPAEPVVAGPSGTQHEQRPAAQTLQLVSVPVAA